MGIHTTIRRVRVLWRFVKRMPQGWHGHDGVVQLPPLKPVIRVLASLKCDPEGALLETVLHESLHFALPDLEEGAVTETAKAQAEAVRKIVFPLMQGV